MVLLYTAPVLLASPHDTTGCTPSPARNTADNLRDSYRVHMCGMSGKVPVKAPTAHSHHPRRNAHPWAVAACNPIGLHGDLLIAQLQRSAP